jgi:hypothetical protein
MSPAAGPASSAEPVAAVVDPPGQTPGSQASVGEPTAGVARPIDLETAAVFGTAGIVVLVSLGALVIGLRRRPASP